MPTRSGRYWVSWADAYARNSDRVDDLSPVFRESVKHFIKALTNGGAKVSISSTKRSDKRAYLFHWSWKISQGVCNPDDAAKMAGVDIEWDHGDLRKSRAGALEMVNGFGLAVPPRSTNAPSLASNHISGDAIDMSISWSGTIKVKKKDGTEVSLSNASNTATTTTLHKIGESYGVKKLVTDAPHWSLTGR